MWGPISVRDFTITNSKESWREREGEGEEEGEGEGEEEEEGEMEKGRKDRKNKRISNQISSIKIKIRVSNLTEKAIFSTLRISCKFFL